MARIGISNNFFFLSLECDKFFSYLSNQRLKNKNKKQKLIFLEILKMGGN
jgi:hypothetical protein